MRAFLESEGIFASINFSGRVDNSCLTDSLVKTERKWNDKVFYSENEGFAKQICGQIRGQMPFSSEYIVWKVIPKNLLFSTVLMFLPQNRSTCSLNTSLLESCFQFFCGLNWQPLAWGPWNPIRALIPGPKSGCRVVLWGHTVVLLSDRDYVNFMLLFDGFSQTKLKSNVNFFCRFHALNFMKIFSLWAITLFQQTKKQKMTRLKTGSVLPRWSSL